ncbi:MAG: hypothetical protein FWF00_05100 [Endomicrobia bacterium]|nr:hypothetical protein [Endomicrobiia bacterium]MCL2507045.1 hypothetical protein [Endomicrobiia bacterium]
MIKNSSGQSLIEALFVVVFTTIIMFAFLQICIMVVDDMTLNEAAFVAMRSVSVTKGDSKDKVKEAEKWAKNYLRPYYSSLNPFSNIEKLLDKSNFGYSDKKTVWEFYRKNGNPADEEPDEEEEIESENNASEAFKVYTRSKKAAEQIDWDKDYSGNIIRPHTAKIYYYTRVMFGSLVAKDTSRGNRRYLSSRSRMVPSPDSDYYYKAYPGARNFDE